MLTNSIALFISLFSFDPFPSALLIKQKPKTFFLPCFGTE